jgi:transcriptional regulator with XRE-family HTH domain
MKSLQERVNEALNSTDAEIERAKIEFTEELLAQMEAQGISRSELARCLGVKPARVTALLRGSNNFTLETMVRICRAIGAKYKHYIQAPSLVTISYHAVPWGILFNSASLIPSSAQCLISSFAQTQDNNLLSLTAPWVHGASPVLTSSALILPTVGQTDLIESRKRIETPKIDANLALAA